MLLGGVAFKVPVNVAKLGLRGKARLVDDAHEPGFVNFENKTVNYHT
jgi:hypothetical protein